MPTASSGAECSLRQELDGVWMLRLAPDNARSMFVAARVGLTVGGDGFEPPTPCV